YDETRDQANAIADVIRDLTSKKVMDRRVCGDVGFAKTEVPLRAAFLALNAGRQEALLCPTTLLAHQHFLTVSSRDAHDPFVVRALSRGRPRAEQMHTWRGLAEGRVAALIGTHGLRSKGVRFTTLALLVVGEEQRFRVGHQERIQQVRARGDVLPLS